MKTTYIDKRIGDRISSNRSRPESRPHQLEAENFTLENFIAWKFHLISHSLLYLFGNRPQNHYGKTYKPRPVFEEIRYENISTVSWKNTELEDNFDIRICFHSIWRKLLREKLSLLLLCLFQ